MGLFGYGRKLSPKQETATASSLLDDKCAECPGLQDRECQRRVLVALADYKPGDKGIVLQVCGDPDFRLRMMEMGFVKGAEVGVVKFAPLSDPMELVIKGYHVSLRREQALDILMDTPQKAA
jgi:ferrous iron transport protein A